MQYKINPVNEQLEMVPLEPVIVEVGLYGGDQPGNAPWQRYVTLSYPPPPFSLEEYLHERVLSYAQAWTERVDAYLAQVRTC